MLGVGASVTELAINTEYPFSLPPRLLHPPLPRASHLPGVSVSTTHPAHSAPQCCGISHPDNLNTYLPLPLRPTHPASVPAYLTSLVCIHRKYSAVSLRGSSSTAGRRTSGGYCMEPCSMTDFRHSCWHTCSNSRYSWPRTHHMDSQPTNTHSAHP